MSRDSLKIREEEGEKRTQNLFKFSKHDLQIIRNPIRFVFNLPADQLIEGEAKVLVCDDFNFEDALAIFRGNIKGLKHLIVVGAEGKAQGCIPARWVRQSQSEWHSAIGSGTDCPFRPRLGFSSFLRYIVE